MSDQADAGRQRFDRQAFELFRQATKQAMVEVPELVAVGLVCVWDFPDQAGLPTAAMFTRDNVPADADLLFRSAYATNRLASWMLDQAGHRLKELSARAAALAAMIEAAEAQTHAQEAPREPAQRAAGEDEADPPAGAAR